MQNHLFILLLITFCCLSCNAQEQTCQFNLGFEKIDTGRNFPENWIKWGSKDFIVEADSTVFHSGKYAATIYPSARAEANSFGSIAYVIPANYKGNRITLTGYLKFKNVEDGYVGLLLRIDGSDGVLSIDNMQKQNLQGTQDWKQYSITLPLPDEARQIFVGGLLTGKGQAWFDSFELFIDGKNIEKLKPVNIPISKAEMDTAFGWGSGIKINSLNGLQQEALFKLGKVWGFIKYYHPEIARGNYNWDKELFRVLPKILIAKSESDINDSLFIWVTSFSLTSKHEQLNLAKDIKLKPPIDWIEDEEFLGQDLSKALINIRDSKREKEHYYLGLTPSVQNPQFKNEKAYPEMKFDDDGMKLLSLYRYWNMINYYFPYRHLMDEDWDSVLYQFIPKVVADTSSLAYRLTMLELIGKVQDTHAQLRDRILHKYWGTMMIPVKVRFVEDKAVITDILVDSLKKSEIVKIGDEIIEVNNKAIAQIASDKGKYIPASNNVTQKRNLSYYLPMTNKDSLSLKINRENKAYFVVLKAYPMNTLREQDSLVSHRIIADSIGYINPGALKEVEIDNIMVAFQNLKGVIIDLRFYPSAFTVFSLGKYLSDKQIEFVKFTVPSIQVPGQFTFTNALRIGGKSKIAFKGKVVVLINENTQSSAEYHAMAFRAAPNTTVIGSQTAGADGNVSIIILPGNLRTAISGKGVYYPDGRETQRVGIVPDIEVKPTINGIRNGRDEVLEKAIEIIDWK